MVRRATCTTRGSVKRYMKIRVRVFNTLSLHRMCFFKLHTTKPTHHEIIPLKPHYFLACPPSPRPLNPIDRLLPAISIPQGHSNSAPQQNLLNTIHLRKRDHDSAPSRDSIQSNSPTPSPSFSGTDISHSPQIFPLTAPRPWLTPCVLGPSFFGCRAVVVEGRRLCIIRP